MKCLDPWQNSFDAPCIRCGNSPCYVLVGVPGEQEPLCDNCYKEELESRDYHPELAEGDNQNV